MASLESISEEDIICSISQESSSFEQIMKLLDCREDDDESGNYYQQEVKVEEREDQHLMSVDSTILYFVPDDRSDGYLDDYSESDDSQIENLKIKNHARKEEKSSVATRSTRSPSSDSSSIHFDTIQTSIQPGQSSLSVSSSSSTISRSARAGLRLYHQAMERIQRREERKAAGEAMNTNAPPISPNFNSSSVRAGNRLYNQAMERFDRLEAIKQRHEGTEDKSLSMSDVKECFDGEAISSSVVAGERLFNQAMERSQRLEAAIKEKSDIPLPTNITLFTTNKHKDNGEINCKSNKPRYLHLYELSKNKKKTVPSTIDCRVNPRNHTVSLDDANNRFNRLYDLSKNQREEGKKRRKEIEEMLKAKEGIPHLLNMEKISLKDAQRLYYTGVRQLLDLDRRRIEYARSKQIEYEPYRFCTALKEKVLQNS